MLHECPLLHAFSRVRTYVLFCCITTVRTRRRNVRTYVLFCCITTVRTRRRRRCRRRRRRRHLRRRHPRAPLGQIHYDAYVLQPSENLDTFHCPKSRSHTFNGISTREQYELAVERIKRDNVNLVASILIFTTATMNMNKEAHAGDRRGGVANPTW